MMTILSPSDVMNSEELSEYHRILRQFSLPGEEWRILSWLPEYSISNLGRVMRNANTAPMPKGGYKLRCGHPWFGVGKGRKHFRSKHLHKNFKIHRLVCEAFHGDPPFENAYVLHLDENPANNRSDNLKWGTQKENLNAPGFIEYCKSRTGNNNPYIKGRKNK